ncbi:class I SAM-dependent methyltransferase [Chitinophaga rhizosphaerae]|uniref:class I SAM-dependent methyltransferase n=1 Tax=Chitinophaga rhizosphaerae TaxID=1864947 RepID=UPI001F0C6FBF|nr:class I SAM-dependent methyltransferase [Chitinophaga rhizosphaerae]
MMQQGQNNLPGDLNAPGNELRTDAARFFHSDAHFNELYPPEIVSLSRRHWTPLPIARKVAAFLAVGNAQVLDIGCGVGKFCLAAGQIAPNGTFYGVEQRKRLLHHAEKAKRALGLGNVHFINANFTQLNFREFDHFYFYNAFYENLDGTDKIDDSIDYSAELFHYYNRFLHRQLDQKPAGTRLVTFHSLEDEVPRDFHVVDSTHSNLLKFWIKS